MPHTWRVKSALALFSVSNFYNMYVIFLKQNNLLSWKLMLCRQPKETCQQFIESLLISYELEIIIKSSKK
jgi:hypothetical protein